MEIKDTYHLVERTDLVCTFDTAVKLKELSAPQNTHRHWYVVKDSVLKGSTPYRKINLSGDTGGLPYSYCEKDKATKEEKVYAAYAAEEILMVLPLSIGEPDSELTIIKQTDGFFCEYPECPEYFSINKNLAEALCKLAVCLYEEGIIKPAAEE